MTVRRELNALVQTYSLIDFNKINPNVLPYLFIYLPAVRRRTQYSLTQPSDHGHAGWLTSVTYIMFQGMNYVNKLVLFVISDIHKNTIRQPYQGWRKHCALLYFVSLSFPMNKNYTVCLFVI